MTYLYLQWLFDYILVSNSLPAEGKPQFIDSEMYPPWRHAWSRHWETVY